MDEFEEIDHVADRAFRIRGRDLAELFANAAVALTAVQTAIGDQSRRTEREIQVTGTDRETLLVNWLNEILYLQEKYRETYARFEVVSISEQQLRARLYGFPLITAHTLIKAVTFHGLEIQQTEQGWKATVVVDV